MISTMPSDLADAPKAAVALRVPAIPPNVDMRAKETTATVVVSLLHAQAAHHAAP